jgi:hypothetical protein
MSVLIRIGYDIVFRLFSANPVIFLLRVHPSRQSTLVVGEDVQLEPFLPVQYYLDSFGNHCGRLNAPAGIIQFSQSCRSLGQWRTGSFRREGGTRTCVPDAFGRTDVSLA